MSELGACVRGLPLFAGRVSQPQLHVEITIPRRVSKTIEVSFRRLFTVTAHGRGGLPCPLKEERQNFLQKTKQKKKFGIYE